MSSVPCSIDQHLSDSDQQTIDSDSVNSFNTPTLDISSFFYPSSSSSSPSPTTHDTTFSLDLLIQYRCDSEHNKCFDIINTLFTQQTGKTILVYFEDFAKKLIRKETEMRRLFENIGGEELKLLTELATIWFYIDSLSLHSYFCLILCDFILLFSPSTHHLHYSPYIHSLYPWYVSKLGDHTISNYLDDKQYTSIDHIDINIDMPQVKNGSSPYYCLNPSLLILDDNQYLVNVRGGGWEHDHGSNYRSLGDTSVVHSNNMLSLTDSSFILSQPVELVEHRNGTKYPSYVCGFEDCRLFLHNQHVYLVCSDRESIPSTYYQTLIARINLDDMSTSPAVLMSSPPGYGYDNEKNWLPFSHNNMILAIYDYNPLTVIEINEETGETSIHAQDIHDNIDLYKFRGSAGPVKINMFDTDGWLIMVHEVIYDISNNNVNSRTYLHRFLFINQDFKLTGLSHIFYLDHIGVEFSLSMIIDNDILRIGLGLEDRSAMIYSYDINYIRDIIYHI